MADPLAVANDYQREHGEPVLRADDLRAWDGFASAFRAHAGTQRFRRRVDSAKATVEAALAESSTPQLAWSGGKDSTALAHLVTVELGARHVRLMSEKDDLDFPGEEHYVRALAEDFGAELLVVHPPSSPLEYMRDAYAAGHLVPGEDIHSRSAALSRDLFYGVVEASNVGRDLIMLGLRKEESHGRMMHRARRGLVYTVASGQRRAQPIADWSGLDVYAYLDRAGVPVLPLYRCIALHNAREPWTVRKSWWLPGAAARRGGAIWLRWYWPSLWRRVTELSTDARRLA